LKNIGELCTQAKTLLFSFDQLMERSPKYTVDAAHGCKQKQVGKKGIQRDNWRN